MRLSVEHISAVSGLLPESATDIEIELGAVLYATLPGTIADRDILAVTLMAALREHFSGSQIYIPKGGERGSERNRRIYAAFNGHNYLELAHEFGLTERYVRAIIENCRAIDAATRQKALF